MHTSDATTLSTQPGGFREVQPTVKADHQRRIHQHSSAEVNQSGQPGVIELNYADYTGVVTNNMSSTNSTSQDIQSTEGHHIHDI